MINITQKLVTLAQFLLAENIAIHAYLTDLTWLLFIKIVSLLNLKDEIPQKLNWNTLINKPKSERYQYYQKILSALARHQHPMIAGLYHNSQTNLKNIEQLNYIINILILTDKMSIDALREIYQQVIKKSIQLNEPYLYTIPSSLVDMMTVLTQPQIGEIIYDPCASMAHFVVSVDQYLQVINEDSTDKKPSIVALESDLMQQRFGLMNCILYDIDYLQPLPISRRNDLLSDLPIIEADLVLSTLINPYFQIDMVSALVEYIVKSLKLGGRAAIIIPDAMLSLTGSGQALLNNCIVHTVLRLPHGIFYPHKILAHLIFLQKPINKKKITNDVWFYDLRTNTPIFGKYATFTREFLKSFEAVYGNDPNGKDKRHDEGEKGYWRCFNRQDLMQRNALLDICWLPEATKSYPQNIKHILEATVKDLKELTHIL
ncbi:MAG: N-6 DNA methylase [Thiomargarita sp.]|nr:N-6 DNA methylase [Thiomargarita sp.]